MAITKTQNRAVTAGIPEQWSETFVSDNHDLIAGDTPAVVVSDLIAYSVPVAIPANSPVEMSSEGTLFVAEDPGLRAPTGITITDVEPKSYSSSGYAIPLLRQGCVNMDAIVWPEQGYEDDIARLRAFETSFAPTSIIVRKVISGATVTLP